VFGCCAAVGAVVRVVSAVVGAVVRVVVSELLRLKALETSRLKLNEGA